MRLISSSSFIRPIPPKYMQNSCMLLLTVTLEEEKRSAQWIIFYILNITPLSSLQSIRTSHLREFCLALGLPIRSWPDWSAFFLVFCFIDSLIKQSWGLSHTLILLLFGFSQYHVAVIVFADLFFPLQKELSCIIENLFSEPLFYQFE